MVIFFQSNLGDTQKNFKKKSVPLLMADLTKYSPLSPCQSTVVCGHTSVSYCAQSCSEGGRGLHQSPLRQQLSSLRSCNSSSLSTTPRDATCPPAFQRNPGLLLLSYTTIFSCFLQCSDIPTLPVLTLGCQLLVLAVIFPRITLVCALSGF